MAADTFSPQKRSEIMSSIHSKNTKAEKVAFRFLRQKHTYFQRHYNRALGKPDIALPRKKKAVFIDGDFWHGRNYEQTVKRLPKVYWQEKIAKNVARDKKNRKQLTQEGWKILVVWESDILRKKTREGELEKIMLFLKK